jgi:hypothetical protein
MDPSARALSELQFFFSALTNTARCADRDVPELSISLILRSFRPNPSGRSRSFGVVMIAAHAEQ